MQHKSTPQIMQFADKMCFSFSYDFRLVNNKTDEKSLKEKYISNTLDTSKQ